ncbi:hypothetical protein PR003_g12828 [Phytophthora rubi]|uniref:Integrase catalytic domain-containing protein n=1 Tax=Phytophthora rubi TaxID=129364 RepID=A0A6A3M8Y6_9STRA|nr:hypothetical protein PR001_g12043 [Phytophthora rubi]KAE9335815.1 hypothetical protein PR003_g12828 [Phytophthora rubi]
MSLDFVFGLPKDSAGNTGVVVFVDRLSKMVHLAAVPDTIDAPGTATLFIDRVFRQHGLPESIVSDRDPRFTGKFWTSVFAVLGTRLDMSTADHPQTDGQTERANRVVEDVLRSICAETPKRWSVMLPLVEFAMNNAVHASTGFTPFYVNGLTHPRVPLTPSRSDSGLGGGGLAARLADVSPRAVRTELDDFWSVRLNVLHVRDAMAESQDVQKEQADARGRGNVENFEVGDLVLLNAKNLPTHAVSAVFKTKLRPRFIGPFKVVAKKGLAYTLNLPKKMRTHPVFYVGLLKPYRDPSMLKLATKSRDLGAELYRGLAMTLRILSRLICEIAEPALNGFQVIRKAVKLLRRPMTELTVHITVHTNLLLELGQLAAHGARVQRRLVVLRRCSMSMGSSTTTWSGF